MTSAIDLLRQGRNSELWQMCCGYLSLNLQEFMDIQKSLLLEQLELLNNCPLGEKIMRGAKPRTIEEFRDYVPLTTYKDYCPELSSRNEDVLPVKADLWVHSSGWSGENTYKWVPLTREYSKELSAVLYGIGMLSCCRGWGDTSQIPGNINILYSVAPRPYISGTFAEILKMQTPLNYMPSLDESENLSFEERLKLGFNQALSRGLDYFFGLSLVLVMVGNKFRHSSERLNIRPFLRRPKALWRLLRGLVRSRLAGRPLLPKDIWSIRGIIGSGVDSWIYKDKIKELWGKHPLDLYSSTEGGVIATQTWDYEGMTFVPNLNFLEFIPEEEHFKWQMDHSYQPKTLLLDEVEPGENYELVLTSLHGGALMRYRIGDMIRITSLRNDNLGIELPQMVFERRTDDILDFVVVKLTEKKIWQAIEKSGVPYEDWVAYKKPGESVLHILLEPEPNCEESKDEIVVAIHEHLVSLGRGNYDESGVSEDWRNELDFGIDITLLPHGTFANYTALKQAEGADPAHLKPTHINPPDEVLSTLLADTEEIIIVNKTVAKKAPEATEEEQKITI